MKTLSLLLKSVLLAFMFSQLAVAATSTEVVNINTADAATLDRVLVGIGPSKAQAIVAYRKANGAFKSADALADVKGIGPATIKRNAGRISTGTKASAKPVPAKTPAKVAPNKK
jgi:competence protein ComEA